MSMVIQHNIPALQSYNIVNNTSNALQKSIAKLSSGLRINSAADDAAGLAISEKMRSQVRGLDRAVANTQDGISLIQTAEGALGETHSILQRMRELAVQGANDTLTQQDRSYIQEEIDQLKEEITRIGNTTQFNKKKLLNGDSAGLWSSSDMETKAIINGGLREVDQFGQKKSIEGNYKIRVKADPGQAEVQKSDIMTIKHPNVITNKTVNAPDGVKDVQVDNMAPGDYSLKLETTQTAYGAKAGVITGSYGIGGDEYTTTYGVTLALDTATTANTNHGTLTVTVGDEDIELGSFSNAVNAGVTTAAIFSDANIAKLNNNKAGVVFAYSNGKLTAKSLGSAAPAVTTKWDTDANGTTGTFGSLNKTTFDVSGLSATAATGPLSLKVGDTTATLSAAGMAGAADADTLFAAANINAFNATTEAKAAGITVSYSGGVLTVEKVGGSAPDTVSLVPTTAGTTSGSAELLETEENPTSKEITATDIFTVNSTANNIENASILFEVTNKDEATGSVTLKATSTRLTQDGKNETAVMDNIVVTEGGTAVNIDKLVGDNDTKNDELTISITKDRLSLIDDNGKFVVAVTAAKIDTANGNDATKNIKIDLQGDIDDNWDDSWDSGVFGKTAAGADNTVTYALNGDSLANSEINFNNFLLNEKTGTVSQGTITMTTDDTFKVTGGVLNKDRAATTGTQSAITDGDTLASFTTSYIGKTANGDVKLRDLDKFWNSEGKFMLDDAKTLTLNQGNGNTATITLYANDTLDEVAEKINNAIAVDLGQSKYVDDATKFATFVSEAGANSEAVPGTFVIRSVVPGKQGEITFSGDQEVLDAFSLNTIQDSKETRYSVDVLDEHSGKILAQNVKTTGNVMYGVINENVDVEFSALSGIKAEWNDKLNKYDYTSEMEETTLHIADNTTVLQIGANEGEDLAMDIGDMRSHALGLDGVNMMSHDRAARSITIIDNAIDRVSTQRAKLGAYQNRLEYTADNLTTASENLTSAESRIRDADMAKEMMEFTKLNIMLQAGNSMLAQANQQPQNVLSLIR